MNGAELIAAERKRQIEVEGFDSHNDDRYEDQSLAIAGACYALPGYVRHQQHEVTGIDFIGAWWPWHPSWWKPTGNDRIRELVKAGALIAAEIDRLQRQEAI